jgi:hypothetical protein
MKNENPSGMNCSVKRYALILPLLLILASARTGSQELKKGESFRVSRSHLLKDGWKPVPYHNKYERVGIERELEQARIVEIESCAVDIPLCDFNYKKADLCLHLITWGETLADLKVYRWSNECSEDRK